MQVSAGYDHTCAIDDTGLVCWGSGSFGKTNAPTLLGLTMATATRSMVEDLFPLEPNE